MNPLKKLKQLCPRSKAPIRIDAKRLSVPIIAIVVVAEIMLLLVAPLAYFAAVAPKPEVTPNLSSQTYPLTESQIEKAWPNLPTAQQLVNSGQYAAVDLNDLIVSKNSTATKLYLQSIPNWWDNSSSLSWILQNETQTNLPGSYGLVPVAYQIYLQLNSTMWIQVPQTLLNHSSHPPTIPSRGQPEANNGFLGTNMPATYGYAAVAVTLVTVAASACCLILLRRKIRAQPT